MQQLTLLVSWHVVAYDYMIEQFFYSYWDSVHIVLYWHSVLFVLKNKKINHLIVFSKTFGPFPSGEG
jgi:hypothetical protein